MAKASLYVASDFDAECCAAGIGFDLKLDSGLRYFGGSYIGEASGSAASYNALVWGLDNAVAAKVSDIELHVDDEDVAAQLTGEARVRNEGLRPLYTQAQILFRRIGKVDLQLVEASQNRLARALAGEGIAVAGMTGDFLRRPALRQQFFDLANVPDVFEPAPIRSSCVMEEYLRSGNVPDAAPAEEEMSWEELDRLTAPEKGIEEEAEGADEAASVAAGGVAGDAAEPEGTLSGFARTAEMVESAFDEEPYVPKHMPLSFASLVSKSESEYTAKTGFGALGLDDAETGREGRIEASPCIEASPYSNEYAASPLPIERQKRERGRLQGSADALDSPVPAAPGPDASGAPEGGPQTVLVGVTGCIAAYKACELVRTLQTRGKRVKVVMTENATRFVGSASFKALTKDKVAVSMFDAPADPVFHISLAREADCMVIAPCTANVLAKLAHGICDDLLSTTALALGHAPLIVAPAMNFAMWENPLTQENVRKLKSRGVQIVPPDTGELACGESGAGRLASVGDIAQAAIDRLGGVSQDLAGYKVLVTAGPTIEPIDPVRYLTNRSSGKTGYEIAAAARRRGAEVTLVSGPVEIAAPSGVELICVNTAEEMLKACKAPFERSDIAVFSAAVCDFAPKEYSRRKLKKQSHDLDRLELKENPDVLAELSSSPHRAVVVGFAAETNDVLVNARSKLASKNADLIVANDVSGELGFGTDRNKVWICSKDGTKELPCMDKSQIAGKILDAAFECRDNSAVR